MWFRLDETWNRGEVGWIRFISPNPPIRKVVDRFGLFWKVNGSFVLRPECRKCDMDFYKKSPIKQLARSPATFYPQESRRTSLIQPRLIDTIIIIIIIINHDKKNRFKKAGYRKKNISFFLFLSVSLSLSPPSSETYPRYFFYSYRSYPQYTQRRLTRLCFDSSQSAALFLQISGSPLPGLL